MKKIILTTTSAALVFLTGCSETTDKPFPELRSGNGNLGDQITDVITCPQSREALFQFYYKAYDELGTPTFGSLKNEQVLKASLANQQGFAQATQKIHGILTDGLQDVLKSQAKAWGIPDSEEALSDAIKESDPILHLARLELRSQISSEYESLNQELDQALEEAKSLAVEMNLDCQAAAVPETQLPTDENSMDRANNSFHPLYGAHWTMATSYQSCNSIDLAPINASTPSVQSVVRGKKVDAVGYGREYTEKTAEKTNLKRTHYYHKDQTYGSACLNQNAKPLVYDYGGQPIVNSERNSLNLFVNSSQGGGALGVDCSAFISTAASKAGNLYKAGSSNNPYYTRFSSRDFRAASGWSCYDSVQVSSTSSILPGDILSINGHVVMIDEMGSDPFGLRFITSSSQCNSLNYKNFDFAVIQSSPSKNSIGINRYEARDYFAESSGMRNAIDAYGKQTCLSKFDNKVRKPTTSSYNIIRHKGTPECLAPKINLVNESCISSCPALKL